MKTLQLTARTIDAAKDPGHYGDGSGLYLQVSDYGTRSWVFRYKLNGKAHEMGLGSVNTFTLKEARERARAARQLLADGIDPIQARKEKRDAKRASEAKRVTFEECARLYIEAHGATWRSERHRKQVLASLEADAFPILGKLNADEIELPHILRVLEPIWKEKTETASRLRGYIEHVLDWATVRKYRKGDNPARWSGYLSELFPSRQKLQEVKHLAALPFDVLPSFMSELRERDDITARALEFTILTAARTGEIVGAKWDEIDLKAAVWTIPATRMKAGRDHRVPLSKRAVEILESLPRGDRLFQIHNMSMVRMLHTMRDGLTVHGFRSTFSDWCRERTNYPRDVVEMALAHAIKDKTEAAYRRGDALEKRRLLMGEWGRYCSSPAKTSSEVVSIHGAA